MATDALLDRYEKIGTPQDDLSDNLISTPIGSPTIPPPEERLAYYPIAGGVPAGGGGPTPPPPDPFFATVAVLLPGNSAVDLSANPKTATVGPQVSFVTTNPVPGVVDSWIKASPGNVQWDYPSSPAWAQTTNYTLDYWLLFDAIPGNWTPFCTSDFSRFVQLTGVAPNADVSQQGSYGAMPSSTLANALLVPFYIRLVCDGIRVSRYVGKVGDVTAARDQTNLWSGAAGGAIGFSLLDKNASGTAAFRLGQVRINMGHAYNNPNDLTIPMQTAPWPTS